MQCDVRGLEDALAGKRAMRRASEYRRVWAARDIRHRRARGQTANANEMCDVGGGTATRAKKEECEMGESVGARGNQGPCEINGRLNSRGQLKSTSTIRSST